MGLGVGGTERKKGRKGKEKYLAKKGYEMIFWKGKIFDQQKGMRA